MALQLMKIHVAASTTTTVVPTPEKFFYVTTAETEPNSTLSIDAADFFDNTGTEVTELPVLATDNSYFNVYVNGALQMGGLTTYTPGITAVGSLAIDVPDGGDSILTDSPIVLEVVNYAPISTTDVET